MTILGRIDRDAIVIASQALAPGETTWRANRERLEDDATECVQAYLEALAEQPQEERALSETDRRYLTYTIDAYEDRCQAAGCLRDVKPWADQMRTRLENAEQPLEATPDVSSAKRAQAQ